MYCRTSDDKIRPERPEYKKRGLANEHQKRDSGWDGFAEGL